MYSYDHLLHLPARLSHARDEKPPDSDSLRCKIGRGCIVTTQPAAGSKARMRHGREMEKRKPTFCL
jgi:hypothetical protein